MPFDAVSYALARRALKREVEIPSAIRAALPLAAAATVTDSHNIMPGAVNSEHIASGVIKPFSALPIVTSSESVTDSTLTTLSQRAMWRGSLLNMERVVKIEAEVDWESGGSGDLDLYDVTNGTKIADLATPDAATSRDTRRYDVTDAVKALTSDVVIGLQAAGDGTNALTVYKATLVVYMSLS